MPELILQKVCLVVFGVQRIRKTEAQKTDSLEHPLGGL